jgi:hypothetical protein
MEPSSPRHRMFVLIENPRKSTNWGPLLRCCTAFGIPQVVVVGYDKCAVQGSHGASKHVELVAFPSHAGALDFLRNTCGCHHFVGLMGGVANAYDDKGYAVVEENERVKVVAPGSIIVSESPPSSSTFPRSFPLHARPFNGDCCLVVGKQSMGFPLSLSLARLCDAFIHVPHGGSNDFSLLNTESCLSIVLADFYLWAGYPNGVYMGQKYEVQKVHKGSLETQQAEREERLQEREKTALEAQAAMDDGCLGNLLGNDDDDDAGDY